MDLTSQAHLISVSKAKPGKIMANHDTSAAKKKGIRVLETLFTAAQQFMSQRLYNEAKMKALNPK